jgi:hypothetical protein
MPDIQKVYSRKMEVQNNLNKANKTIEFISKAKIFVKLGT